MGPHEQSISDYLKTYDKLSNDHPAIVGVVEMAKQLDDEYQAGLAATYQLAIRWLEKYDPNNTKETGDEDDLLTPNR